MTSPMSWDILGFVGQGMFMARFVVQWLASEKKANSVVPTAFWWLSLLGGILVLIYSVHLQNRVFIFGQSLGLVVYVRNLMLVAKNRRQCVMARTCVPKPHLVRKGEVALSPRQD